MNALDNSLVLQIALAIAFGYLFFQLGRLLFWIIVWVYENLFDR